MWRQGALRCSVLIGIGAMIGLGQCPPIPILRPPAPPTLGGSDVVFVQPPPGIGEAEGREAEDAYRQALQLFESVGQQVGDPSEVGAFQQANQGTLYARYARLMLHRNRADRALEIVERGRGQGLARQIAYNRLDRTHRLNPDDAGELRQLTEKLSIASRFLRAVQSRNIPADTEAQQPLAQQLAAARARYDDAERRLSLFRDSLLVRPEYAAYRRQSLIRPPTSADLRALARRHPDTLYLEWAGVDDRTTLLFALSRRRGLQFFLLPIGSASLAKEVGAWRAALTARQRQECALAARQLYAALFGPLEGAGLFRSRSRHWGRRRRGRQPTFRHLVLVPDGPLLDLPFAALLNRRGRRLIERFALSTCVSLGELTWPQDSPVPRRTLLCVADPPEARGRPISSIKREEGRQVAQLFSPARLLTGPHAEEIAVKREMERCALLHFAVPDVINTHAGLHSGLALAPEPAESTEDGVLEAREIARMRLAARLVVLSAGETARGQVSGGEGVLGLTWAFRAAGCPCIVASQWATDDEATRRLMLRFYRGLRANRRADDALRQAMLRLKRFRRYAAPYYWAAFEICGNADRVLDSAAEQKRN